MYSNRLRMVNHLYADGLNDQSYTNMAADEIIETPDKHLLTQDALFEAEGGYNTFALQMGLAFTGFAAAAIVNPRLVSYLRNGQLRFYEWAAISAGTSAGYLIGGHVGTKVLGDQQVVTNHWLAYTFVKEQNRMVGRRILCNSYTY